MLFDHSGSQCDGRDCGCCSFRIVRKANMCAKGASRVFYHGKIHLAGLSRVGGEAVQQNRLDAPSKGG